MMKDKDKTTVKSRYFDLILGAFAVVLVISNIASTKVTPVGLGPFHSVLDAGTFLFPLTYIFGDVLTEVYGYARARRVVWFGMAMNLFTALVLGGVALLPTDPTSPTKGAFETVFNFAPQIVLASLIAFFVGEFLNAFVLAKLKIRTNGRWLFVRTIGSTLVGEGADTLLFSLIAYGWGAYALPSGVLWGLIATNYLYKVGLEVVLTPVTYAVVRFLKRKEGIDHFDRGTNFNPFALSK